MSPNSSSKCRADGKTRSATPRTISAWPSSGRESVVAANSTPCARPARHHLNAPAPAGNRGAIVRGGRRVFVGISRAPPRHVRLAARRASSRSARLALAGCGGGSPATARRTDGELQREGRATRASRARQAVATTARMMLVVRNTGIAAIPNVAVTVDSFNYRSNYPGLAANKRPVWVIERGPGHDAEPAGARRRKSACPAAAQTSYVNTWALGPLAPPRQDARSCGGWCRSRPGSYTVHYIVAAGLAGQGEGASSPPAGRRVGTLPRRRSRGEPPDNARRTRRPARSCRAPTAVRRSRLAGARRGASRVWPRVEIAAAALFRQTGDPLWRAAAYD